MRTSSCGEFEIEDVLGHPAEMLEELREQLSDCHRNTETLRAGSPSRGKMVPDPKRAGFYEVQSTDFTYYIHVIPGSGKVLLLAAWPTA